MTIHSLPFSVVNIHHVGNNYDVFIGRRKGALYHFGNPFSHLAKSIGTIQVATRLEAMHCCNDWLCGKAHQKVEPERRDWILSNLGVLHGRLGCYCAPLDCHGDIYVAILEDREWSPRAVVEQSSQLSLF